MIEDILGSDPALVGVSFAWIFLVIAVAESARRVFRLAPDVSRKTVHVLVAFWALPTALLFHSAVWAAVTPLVFVVLNAVSWRFRLMAVIEEDGQGSPGTIYFPLSLAVLTLALWPHEGGRAASVAGMFAMGFGDASASILGRRFGKHRYTVAGGTKSWEGSAVMALASFAAILLGTLPLLDRPAVVPAVVAAVVAAVAEAPAGRGLDNITVPILSGLAFLWLL